jgi:histidyl-tRNA synthetase
MAGADIEAELLAITASLWQRLGVADAVQLEINSIGSLQARGEYKAALVAYLQDRFDQLDADSQRRLDSNPLRILDSKNPETQALLADAPALHDYLDEESAAHHAQLKQNLDALGIAYVENPRLVRGLDYYGKTVFEWTTERLGAQGTVCAGGRYDGLVEQLGGKPTPGVGFAMGVERLCLLVEEVAPDRVLAASADAYFVVMDSELQGQALALAEKLRAAVPGLRLQMHCGGGSLKSQMKKADRSGASFGIMLGSDEAERGVVTLKHLRDKNFEQQTLDHVALIAFFQQS